MNFGLRALAGLAGVVLLSAGLGCNKKTDTPPPPTAGGTTTQNTAAAGSGAELYQQYCVKCHRPGGGAKIAPRPVQAQLRPVAHGRVDRRAHAKPADSHRGVQDALLRGQALRRADAQAGRICPQHEVVTGDVGQRYLASAARNRPARSAAAPVVGRLVRPRGPRVEHLGRHAGARRRHRHPEHRVGPERRPPSSFPSRAACSMARVYASLIRSPDPVAAAGPAGVHQPHRDLVPLQLLAAAGPRTASAAAAGTARRSRC